VNGYLNHEGATWVNAHISWAGLADGSADDTVRAWATRAQNSGKKFLLSVDYVAPPALRRAECSQPEASSVNGGNNAIQSMRAAVKDLYQYPGMGSLWGNVQLEIGPESNFDPDCNIRQRDAQLWWDVVNGLARQAKNGGWAPGLGIVSGGAFTNRGIADGGFGTHNVGARAYLEEGIGNTREFGWEHYNDTWFDAYGTHTGHRSDVAYRTTWSGADGIQDRINDVRAALVNKDEPGGKEIEVTALIPTQTRDDGTPSEATQENDTTSVWNNIRTTYAGYDKYALDLVVWNHIVDTNQGVDKPGNEDFARAGFMTCDHPTTCATEDSYTGKAVYRAAPDWNRTIG
jgi:hypothetical protein